MPLPGNVGVADRFKFFGSDEDLGQRVRRYQQEGDNSSPQLPSWLAPLSGFQAAEPNQQQKTEIEDASDIGTAANVLAQQQLEYRRQAAASKRLADQQAQNEQNSQFNQDLENISGGTGGTGGGGGANLPINAEGKRAGVLAAAKRWIGTPYSWGGGGGRSRGRSGPTTGIGRGSGTKGFDCSGLTDYAFSSVGLKIGGSTLSQEPWAKAHGKVVPKSKLVPGDIVFGGPSGDTHHVAIYWGNGKILEAPFTGGRVRIVPMRAGQFGYHLNY